MPEQARATIATKYGIYLDEHLKIHGAAAPFDFFLILSNNASYLTMLNGDRTVHTLAFSLIVRPWSRL